MMLCIYVYSSTKPEFLIHKLVIAVIVKHNEHKLHRLGTKYVLVKEWYNSASLKPATSNF